MVVRFSIVSKDALGLGLKHLLRAALQVYVGSYFSQRSFHEVSKPSVVSNAKKHVII